MPMDDATFERAKALFIEGVTHVEAGDPAGRRALLRGLAGAAARARVDAGQPGHGAPAARQARAGVERARSIDRARCRPARRVVPARPRVGHARPRGRLGGQLRARAGARRRLPAGTLPPRLHAQRVAPARARARGLRALAGRRRRPAARPGSATARRCRRSIATRRRCSRTSARWRSTPRSRRPGSTAAASCARPAAMPRPRRPTVRRWRTAATPS